MAQIRLRTAKKSKSGIPEIKLIEIQVPDVHAVHRKERQYSCSRALMRFICCTIVILWQERERVSVPSSQYHTIDSRQDLDLELTFEIYSKGRIKTHSTILELDMAGLNGRSFRYW